LVGPCAELFAAHGATVVLSDIDSDPTHEAAAQIKSANGDALAVPGDVTSADFAPQLIKAALDGYGRIDAIVNNAGYTWDGTIHKMSDEQWQAMLDVHLTAPFRIIRAASEYLRETAKREKETQGRATPRKIVNVSSDNGHARQRGPDKLRRGQSRNHRRHQDTGKGVGPVQYSG
jgi:3-oxoacyl-[acyl-carrier protein] reductase